MTELPELRPVGTEFEAVTETPTERTITRLKVARHVMDADGNLYEVIEELSSETLPKTVLGGSERK